MHKTDLHLPTFRMREGITKTIPGSLEQVRGVTEEIELYVLSVGVGTFVR